MHSSKQSSLPNYLADWLIPPASAQATAQSTANLEYKITRKLDYDCMPFSDIFNKDCDVRGYPFWHGYELQSSPDGIKIAGGSILAQQVIVVPKDKVKMKGLTYDDYGGKKILDKDVVAELLLLEQEIGVWDGNAVVTASGGSRKEQIITPRDGGKWKHGDYVVLISAGSKLNRTSDKDPEQPHGAFTINVANEITDMFTLAGLPFPEGNTKEKVERVASIGGLLSGCYTYTKKNTSTNTKKTYADCLAEPDNLTKIAKAFGIKEEDLVQGFFKLALKRESWEGIAKFIGRVIDPVDKSIALSRNVALGQYLNREIEKGIYSAEISIIDPVVLASAPRNIALQCSREKTEILDMEIQLGGGLFCPGELTVKNYSNYAIELLNKGADSFLVLPNNVNSDSQSFSFRGRVYRDEVGTAEVGIGGSRTSVGTVYKYPFTVKRLDLDTRLPEKDITFNCDDKDLPVKWGLKIVPKCIETGTYAEYTNYAQYPIDVIFADKVIPLKRINFGSGGSGTLRSGSRTVTIKIRANLN
jgi:hypothetical protein